MNVCWGALGFFELPPAAPRHTKSAVNQAEKKPIKKDQVKGTLKDVAGKVQQKTGELMDSPEQQAKGLAKQVEGKTQKAAGDIKDAAKNAFKK